MARVVHRAVQLTDPIDAPALYREINDRLDGLTRALNNNQKQAGPPQLNYDTAVNGISAKLWFADADYDVYSITHQGLTAAGTFTPRINGVNMGSGAITVVAAATNTLITAPKRLTSLDYIDILTVGLTGRLSLSLHLRRLT